MTPALEKKLATIMPPAEGFAVGAVLNDTYRIIRRLAEGGVGEVYLAAHTRLPGGFAVKLLHRSLARNGEALARFRQEAEITSTLRHPHIVQVFDFNVTDAGLPYLVMELLEGQPLSQLVASGLPLVSQRAIAIVDQIAQALHVAHERGIVHRDLKPDNVMLLSATGAEDFVRSWTSGSRRRAGELASPRTTPYRGRRSTWHPAGLRTTGSDRPPLRPVFVGGDRLLLADRP